MSREERNVRQREAFHRQDFTLIELLVVIAIIAILASLLLPALRQAKEKAQQSVCEGHHKQLGMATQMYADDYEDWIPSPSDGVKIWRTFILPYVEAPNISTIAAVKETVFQCPSWVSPSVNYCGIGMNVYIPPMTGWADVGSPTIKPKLRLTKNPETQMLYADSGDWHLATSVTSLTVFGHYKFDRFRHSMGANILFTGLHVRKLSAGEIGARENELYGK
jgi:prepilin-type N-terminal cleavage/methylation domain-containing protein